MLPLPSPGHDRPRHNFSIRIELVMIITRLRASPRHGGAGSFLVIFQSFITPRGRPFGGGGVHPKKELNVVFFFNIMIFTFLRANSGIRSLFQSLKFIGLSDPFEMNLISKIYRITAFQISIEISSFVPRNGIFLSFVKST